MRFGFFVSVVLVAAACSGGATTEEPSSSFATTVPIPPQSTTTEPTALETCSPLESFPDVLPERVVDGVPQSATVEFDEFTLIGGAYTATRFDVDGAPVVVAIRGALPPRQFTEPHQTVTILDDVPTLVGPIGDGYWAAAWAIPPGDRCDLYSLIFYPPVDEEGIAAVLDSIG